MKSLIIIFQSRDCFLAPAPHLFNAVQTVLPSVVVASGLRLVELQTKVREDFTIKIILRHYAKQDLKLGHRHKDHN